MHITEINVDEVEILFFRIFIADGNEPRSENRRPSFDPNVEEDSDNGVCMYDGSESILYWCDALSEIAFVVPSLRQSGNESNISKSSNFYYQPSFITFLFINAMKLQVAGANIVIV